MAQAQAWYIDNTILVTLSGLSDARDDSPVNDATVTATLLDTAGEEVTGETWPVALAYVADSDGDYRGVVSNAVELTERRRYTLRIEATRAGLGSGEWEIPVRALDRTE